MVNVWHFESTGEAYDATQCDDDIKTGDVLVIASEGVVGIAATWPLAVTAEHGKLHTLAEGYTLETDEDGKWVQLGSLAAAQAEIAKLAAKTPFIPPSVQGVITAISARGWKVSVRQTRNGSNRYSVNGARETDALTLIKRFDAGKFSRDLNEEMLDNFNWVGSRHHY